MLSAPWPREDSIRDERERGYYSTQARERILFALVWMEDRVVLGRRAVIETGDTVHEVIENIKNDLNILIYWMTQNRLSINLDKTKFMIFDSNNTKVLPSFNVNQQVVSRCENLKYLELLIDERLSWSKHIEYLIGKILPMGHVMFKLRDTLNQDEQTKIYFAHIQSHLSYLCPIWGRPKSSGSDTKENIEDYYKLPRTPSATLF